MQSKKSVLLKEKKSKACISYLLSIKGAVYRYNCFEMEAGLGLVKIFVCFPHKTLMKQSEFFFSHGSEYLLLG